MVFSIQAATREQMALHECCVSFTQWVTQRSLEKISQKKSDKDYHQGNIESKKTDKYANDFEDSVLKRLRLSS